MANNNPDDTDLTIDGPNSMNSNANQGTPESEAGSDNAYTRLDEQGFEALDEENDREVSSRGGHANLTQNVEAGYDNENADDAEIRRHELPIQNLEDN